MSHIRCAVADHSVLTPAEERDGFLFSNYTHQVTRVETVDGRLKASVQSQQWKIRTAVKVPKTGLLLVGLGGNNGSTLAASLISHQYQLSWEDKYGVHRPNWLGSVAMMSTCKLGIDSTGNDVYVPIRSMLPMLHPADLVVGGWDISKSSMCEAVRRAEVIPLELQRRLKTETVMDQIPVWPGCYLDGFIASNQEIRADNILQGSRAEVLVKLRADIAQFRKEKELDKVIVLWTGNTERFVDHAVGFDDTAANLMAAVESNHSEISPSCLYALAAVLEGCTYINGSPQNTFSNGLIELARQRGVYLAGDDLKTGQTKIKSVLTDFLVSTALKPTSIVSYNHLGNNDGLNLSSEKQFKSKELTKSSVVDDMIASNALLYPTPEDKPDHLIVIKYIPAVGDSKRAMDEYTAKIFMDGTQTIVLHNTCEDSLLAVPIILDLVIFAELFERVEVMAPFSNTYSKFNPVLSLLSLFLKAPQVPKHAPVINALFSQREALVAFMRAACGLPPQDYLSLEHRL